jgi:hypothetical protein
MPIVMGIIIILMAVGIASGRFAIRRANKIEHQNAAEQIYQAAQSYYSDNREYPIESASFYISQEINGEWVLRYKEPFTVEYSTKEFVLDNQDTIRVQIEQKNIPFGDIEQVVLKACEEEITPEYAKYVLSQESVLEDILYDDNNVIVNHENPIEILWNIPQGCNEDPILYLTANEYDSNPEDAFRFPNGKDYSVRYDFQNNKSIVVDGEINEVDGIQEPLFKPFWTPATGHPADYTYIYLSDDEQYVYLSLDIVIDNTKEYGLDWLKIIALNSISGVQKEYLINDLVDIYGKCGFGLTSKVDYKHQTCEVRIPKSEIGNNYLDFYLQYYGTMAEPTSDTPAFDELMNTYLDQYIDDFDGGSEASYGYAVDPTGQVILICVTYGGNEDVNGLGVFCTGNGIGSAELFSGDTPAKKDIDNSTADQDDYNAALNVFNSSCANWDPDDQDWDTGNCVPDSINPPEPV